MITSVLGRMDIVMLMHSIDSDYHRYMNNWDKKIANVDVADDYRSEREEIHRAQGKDFPFSFGDVSRLLFISSVASLDSHSQYVVKVLMGGVDTWFDTLDERRVTTNGPPRRESSKGKKKSSCSVS